MTTYEGFKTFFLESLDPASKESKLDVSRTKRKPAASDNQGWKAVNFVFRYR
jgi:hypothetical protein